MNPSLREQIANANFHPTEAALQLEKRLSDKLGGQRRYEPIRLMLARSLRERDNPPPLAEEKRAKKKSIRGRDLFGNDLDLWISIFLLEGNFGEQVRLDDFRKAVEAHWARGGKWIADDWEKAKGEVAKLAQSLANLLPESSATEATIDSPTAEASGAIRLRLGPVGKTHPEGESVDFALNGAGSPHIVLMGKTGTGKTRIGVHLIRQILQKTRAPFLYIDPKPDFAPGCQYHKIFDEIADAKTLVVGSEAIPLDFLPQASRGNTALQGACIRLRDSLCRPAHAASTTQKNRLLNCVESVARSKADRSINGIQSAYDAALEEENAHPDSVSSVLSELTRFHVFEPAMPPEKFFSQSWVLSLSPDIPQSYRNLIMQLLLDAEAAFWLSRDDAPLHNGHRTIRHLLVIDEANRVLHKNRSESLQEMITQTRQRGCAVTLLSQNPKDFEGQDYDYMTQIGTAICFACNQSDRGLTPLKGIFGRKVMAKEFSENRLSEGLAFCKLPGRKPEVIRCF